MDYNQPPESVEVTGQILLRKLADPPKNGGRLAKY
jgi:hypothetical protein